MADDIIKIDNWSNIAKLDDGNGVIMPFIQELFLIECRIAGTSFVEDMEERAQKLTAGATVSLVREVNNAYDSLAIRIDDANGKKLGYVPRKNNEILARLLDGGKLLFGKVISIEFSEHSSWVCITIKIFMKDI